MGFNIHYPVHKIPLFFSILSQFNSPRLYPLSYRSIWKFFSHLRIGLPKWPLSFRFPYQNSICTSTLPHTCHVPLPTSHPSWFNYPIDIGWRVQFMKLLITRFSLVPSYLLLLSLRSKYFTQHRIQKHSQPRFRFIIHITLSFVLCTLSYWHLQ
jgi:hypothetical protein